MNIKNIMKYTIIFLLLLFLVYWVIPMFIYNNGLQQLTIKDKFNFYYSYFLFFKRGLAGFRPDDVVNLNKYYSYDPIGIKYFKHINENYKHGIGVCDLYFKKVFVVGNPDVVKFIFQHSPNMFGPAFFKQLFMGQIMPKNIGVTKCPFSKTKICEKYNKKRIMNEEIFKTKKKMDYYDIIENSICQNITRKITKHEDFKEFTMNSMADLYFGHNSIKVQKLLSNMFNYVTLDSDIGMHTIINKITTDREPIKKVAQYIRDNDMKNSVFSRFKDYESMHETKFDLSNEIPHWIGPYLAMMEFFSPILLHIILKRKDVYDKLMSEINSGIIDIRSKHSYIHYCVVEFFRLFNIISIHPARIVQDNITYKGILFPKGAELAINLATLLRNEKDFKKPDHFIPKRWENKSVEEQHIIFGFGTQRCPSINFTPLIFKIFINHLLSNYDYKLNTNQYPTTELPHWINGFKLTF